MLVFWVSVRSKKKEEYELDTLRGIQSSLNRYLLESVNINIITDPKFEHLRDVLHAKMKELKAKGLDNNKIKTEPFTKEELVTVQENNIRNM